MLVLRWIKRWTHTWLLHSEDWPAWPWMEDVPWTQPALLLWLGWSWHWRLIDDTGHHGYSHVASRQVPAEGTIFWKPYVSEIKQCIDARLLSSVFSFDNWTIKPTKNYWGEILWFFKNKTLPIQGLCSAANVSHVIRKNWGNFQSNQFTGNSQQICRQPGLNEIHGKGMDLAVEPSHIKLC